MCWDDSYVDGQTRPVQSTGFIDRLAYLRSVKPKLLPTAVKYPFDDPLTTGGSLKGMPNFGFLPDSMPGSVGRYKCCYSHAGKPACSIAGECCTGVNERLAGDCRESDLHQICSEKITAEARSYLTAI